MSAAPSPLELVVVENGLSVESSGSMLSPFLEFLGQAESWKDKVATIRVTDVSQVREMALAKQTRLALKEIRVASDKQRKAMKDESLKRGRMIDGLHAVIEGTITPLENQLREQEEFAIRKETARKLALKTSREEMLRPYGADTSFYDLGAMPDQTFADLLEGTRQAYETKQAASRAAEEARIAAEKAERERLQKLAAENARLKAEKDAAEALAKKEREEAAAAQRTEREKAEAARIAEHNRHQAEIEAANRQRLAEKAEADRKAKEEREAREKAERELARVRESEAAKARQEAEAARKAAMAPDKEKLAKLARDIRAFQVPEMDSAAGVSAQVEILMLVDELAEKVERIAASF